MIAKASQWNGRIWEWQGGSDWELRAECTFPALPFSAVKRENDFYVGMGCRGRKGGSADAVSGQDAKAGTIYELVI